MAKSKYIETLEEQYTKKDAKSVLRYKAPDGKWRYVQTSKDASGGNMPSGGGMVEVKWQELKDKRDNGELNPGSLYRITDYNCTTSQENTQSAGHQFDIVLLALSEDKLAEEGWAMMHDGVDMFNDYDIYTVTFNDGVTKQIYYKEINEETDVEYRFIDTKTFLGNSIWHDPAQDGFVINTENKTITNAYVSSTQFEELLIVEYPYNYFQNSNLSAWKVWYCLDNDKSRFAWADDSVDESSPASINKNDENPVQEYFRFPEGDRTVMNIEYYCWANIKNSKLYTKSETPSIGDPKYTYQGSMIQSDTTVSVFTPSHEGTGLPNGRGVIYRLIDEWNNDVGYDFKNIQFIRPMTDGKYDAQGTDTWVYTFNAYDVDNTVCLDCSMINGRDDIVSETEVCANNTIKAYINYLTKYELSYNSVVMTLSEEGEQIPYCLGLFIDSESYGNTIIENNHTISLYKCLRCSFKSNNALYVYFLENESIQDEEFAIYINNKKVLTEE